MAAPTPNPKTTTPLPTPRSPLVYTAVGLGGAALIGGVIFLATRDAKAATPSDKKKLLPKRPPRGASGGRPGGRRPRGRVPRGRGGGGSGGPQLPGGTKTRPSVPSGGGGRKAKGGRSRPPARKRPGRRRRGGPRGGPRADPPRSNRPKVHVDPTPQPANDAPPAKGDKKNKMAGGTERRNVALAVVAQPTTHAKREVSRGDSQTLPDWLADVAYWNTYPNAPLKLDPANKTHKRFIKAWLRIRQYVGKGLTLLPNLGGHPVLNNGNDVADKNWHRWALAVSFSSPLRTVGPLRSGFKKAWHYVFLDAKGVKWQHQHVGKSVGGQTVGIEGLLAEAAVWHTAVSFPEAHRTLARWPETMTKAFASANRIMVRTK